MIVHAGLVAVRQSGRWRGALIEGASGSGKSDLALRARSVGFRLVADDRVCLWASAGRLFGRAPDALAGLMEIRGLGVVTTPAVALTEVVLLVRAATGPEEVERMSALRREPVLGILTPVLDLWLTEPSAPAKLLNAIMYLGAAK